MYPLFMMDSQLSVDAKHFRVPWSLIKEFSSAHHWRVDLPKLSWVKLSPNDERWVLYKQDNYAQKSLSGFSLQWQERATPWLSWKQSDDEGYIDQL